jgi:CelD/BcsL family acetyltransferase involved in cellulose biosynthesis/GNAT superfamily N-acetyltransferase
MADSASSQQVAPARPANSPQIGSLLVYAGAEASRIFESRDFQSEWKSLVERCPWSTAFQTPEFACTWYRCYAELYDPLILVRYCAPGKIDGFLALAVERATGKLTSAGAHQSEYNVWLALPGEQTFVTEALTRLQQLGFSSLSFVYLPPHTPLEWLEAGWSRTSTLRTVTRPLVALNNPDAVRDSSKKKTRRRMEKLQAIGTLAFLELQTPEELDVYYDEIIDFYDIRIGGIHARCPFRDDPRKRSFFRALMAHRGLLHVAVMKVGQQLIAAHIGIRNKDEVIMVLVGHSPFFGDYSPGKLHTLQLGLMLHQQGFASIDLTPGGDAYKEDRASRYDEAYILSVFLNRKAWVLHSIASSTRSLAKKITGIFQIDKERLSRWRSSARDPIRFLRSLFGSIKDKIWSSTEMRLYRAEANVVRTLPDSGVRRNNLRHLLCYEAVGRNCPSKPEFLRDALSRIESGAQAYSITHDDVLVSYAWLTPQIGKSFISEVLHTYEYPPHSVSLQQIYMHPSYRGQGFCTYVLERILNDAASDGNVHFVYTAVQAGDRAGRQVIEKTGFKYQNSIIREVRFGAAKTRVATNRA